MGSVPDDAGRPGFLRATGFTFHSTVWDLALPPDGRWAPPACRTAWSPAVRPLARRRDLATADQRRVRRPPTRPHGGGVRPGRARRPERPRRRRDPPSRTRRPARSSASARRRPPRRPIVADHGEIGRRRAAGPAGSRARSPAAAGGRGPPARLGIPNVSLAVNGRNEAALGLYESEGSSGPGRGTAGAPRVPSAGAAERAPGRRPSDLPPARGDRRPAAARGAPRARSASRSPGSSTAGRGLAVDRHGLSRLFGLPVLPRSPLEQRRYGGLPPGRSGSPSSRASSSPATSSSGTTRSSTSAPASRRSSATSRSSSSASSPGRFRERPSRSVLPGPPSSSSGSP